MVTPIYKNNTLTKKEAPHQDGNDELIIGDFEMIPTQAIDLDPMMELRVENSVETGRF